MRPRSRALVHRLKEIFDFVKDLRRDVVVIENCDCVDFEDERRIRATTGANTVIIATAAEANSTFFSLHQLTDLENTFILAYLRLCKYLDNHWASTKFCISQLRSRKSANKALRNAVMKAKGHADLDVLVKDWTGCDEFAAIKTSIAARAIAPPTLLPATDDDGSVSSPAPASQLLSTKSCEEIVSTPPGWCGNPDPAVVHNAPLLPAGISKWDPRRRLSLSRREQNLHL